MVYASSKAAVSTMTECLAAQLVGRGTKLRAAIFYPSGGMLRTGIWTTKRNRPAALARKQWMKPLADDEIPVVQASREREAFYRRD